MTNKNIAMLTGSKIKGGFTSDFKLSSEWTQRTLAASSLSPLQIIEGSYARQVCTTRPHYGAGQLYTKIPKFSNKFTKIKGSFNVYLSSQAFGYGLTFNMFGDPLDIATNGATTITDWSGLNSPQSGITIGCGYYPHSPDSGASAGYGYVGIGTSVTQFENASGGSFVCNFTITPKKIKIGMTMNGTEPTIYHDIPINTRSPLVLNNNTVSWLASIYQPGIAYYYAQCILYGMKLDFLI